MKRILEMTLVCILCLSMLSIFVTCTSASSSQQPMLEWDRTFGGVSDDVAWSVVQTNDGGYAIAGWTASLGAENEDFWLVKINSTGGIEWNQTYGGPYWERAYCLIQTKDGGFAIAGETRPYSTSYCNRDFLLVKTDANGSMRWSRTYGGSNQEEAYSVIQTRDNGYAIAGRTISFGAGGSEDMWLVKTDADGNLEWSHPYGGTGIEIAYSVIQADDGGYAIGGETGSRGEERDMLLVKTDPTGNVQWQSTYGRAGSICEFATSLIQTTDGGYAMAGFREFVGADSDFYLVKTDKDGAAQWDKTYGGPTRELALDAFQTSDGGYMLAGGTNWLSSPDLWLVKTDSVGNEEWNQTYGGAGSEWAYSVIQTTDGGYAIAGCTTSFGAGNYDFWLMKLAPRARLVDFFLHGCASLDNNSPTALTAKYKDSPSIKFSGGNPWKEIGIWTAPASLADGRLEALCGVDVWLGLKNSDDQGTNFDLRVEVYKDGVLVASGETYLIKGVTRNPEKAMKATVSFGSFSPVDFDGINDTLSLKIFTRIGTDGNGNFGGGHSSAVGLRLYFDAVSRPTMLAASIA